MPAHTITNTPNTVAQQYKVKTSFDAGLSTTNEFGVGSIKKRDVASNVALYKPYNNALDTLIQLTAGFREVSQTKYEWFEEDEYLPAEAVVATPITTAGAPTADMVFSTNDDTNVFRKGDRIRYVSSGNWVYALITGIDVATNTVSVKHLGAGNLPDQTASSVVQRLDSLRGSDLNYDPEPRSALPRMYSTVVRKMVHDIGYTPRSTNIDEYIDTLAKSEMQLFNEMRRSRELGVLYGNEFKTSVTSSDGDQDDLYVTQGLYDSVDAFNSHALDTTSTNNFEAFKTSIYNFMEHNFGGESGGPSTRQMFVSGKFASILSQAFEDKQRFYGNEFVAGINTMRFENNLGIIDFIHLPIFEYQHPLVGGSLKEGAGKAVGLMIPVEECVERLVFKNEGPSSETFKLRGGDEVEYMRVKTTEGIALRLKQYCATLEEA